MAGKLDAPALQRALKDLPGWRYDAAGGAIRREFTFPDFSAAFGFMARVALAAQVADHHPDWSNSYNKVRDPPLDPQRRRGERQRHCSGGSNRQARPVAGLTLPPLPARSPR